MNSKKGVLLINLGSPDSPSAHDVRRYLAQFLMDRNVIDLPAFFRFLLVYLTILPTRPKNTAAAYANVWRAEGSPLIIFSEKLRRHLDTHSPVPVELGMRYGNPSIPHAIEKLIEKTGHQLGQLKIIPLYPHYAASSFGTAVEAVKNYLAQNHPRIRSEVRAPYYDEPRYIQALCASMRPHLAKNWDHLLFSYHGLPERHLRKADPTKSHCLCAPDCCEKPGESLATCYRAQVFRTTAATVSQLGIDAKKVSISFQSRLGRDPWLTPFTDHVLTELPGQGVKKLAVVCPAFVCDCLETLEEIGDRGRRLFLGAGGEEFDLIPCLNDQPEWLKVLESWT